MEIIPQIHRARVIFLSHRTYFASFQGPESVAFGNAGPETRLPGPYARSTTSKLCDLGQVT